MAFARVFCLAYANTGLDKLPSRPNMSETTGFQKYISQHKNSPKKKKTTILLFPSVAIIVFHHMKSSESLPASLLLFILSGCMMLA